MDPSQSRAGTRVLVVTDQVALAASIRLVLNHGRFITQHAPSMAEAERLLGEWLPHLIIVDTESGEGSPMRMLARGAADVDHVPVVALTQGNLTARLEALNGGVDDIISKPFVPDELVARAIAVVRRTHRREITVNPVIRIGELAIDISRRRVAIADLVITLTRTEESLLYVLAANAGRVLTRDEILGAVWGVDSDTASNVVDRHIQTLRKKLQNSHRVPRYIFTVPKAGYRFMPVTGGPRR